MQTIYLTANFFKPNLRILKNYIITFNKREIKLYDLKGTILDNVIFKNRDIVNIEIIKDNYIIVSFNISIIIMKINFGILEFHKIFKLLFYSKIFIIRNIFLIKNKNLLVIESEDKMEIFDINNLDKKPIQVIFNKSISNFNFNGNTIISYNNEYISLFHNIKGTKIYQLSSKLKLIGRKYITKLNGKILLIFLNNEILYSLNIKNLEINK